MGNGDAMYREDAEKLARRIQEEDPMVEILDIRLEPDVGGYVVAVYDHETEEEYVVEHHSAWSDLRSEIVEAHMRDLTVEKIRTKRGRKTAHLRGPWEPLSPEEWPEFISGALERGESPGQPLLDAEPSLLEVDAVEPGRARPGLYSIEGNLLVLADADSPGVWRRVLKTANFTAEDQSGHIARWRELGIDISPEPRSPLPLPVGEELDEPALLEEMRDRLLDISDQGFEAILVGDGPAGVTAYSWLLAGIMGLKVITCSTLRREGPTSAFSFFGYRELLHYKSAEESITGNVD